MQILGYTLGYLLIINLITFITFGVDKRKAQKDKWRISEDSLVTLMLIGGAIGSYLGINKFRHKTQKTKFKVAQVLSYITFVLIIAVAIKFGFNL